MAQYINKTLDLLFVSKMKNDTLLFLATSQDVSAHHPQPTSHGEVRVNQYINGLKKLFEYDFNNKADVMICDNTTNNLNKRVINALPCNTRYLTYKDNLGATSKSIGLYHQWKSSIEEINKYEWIIHFEPRQILKNHLFFDSFFKNKRSLFNERTNHFWTGLFCIDTEIMLNYLNSGEPPCSIEYHIFDFMQNYKYDCEDINILWHDVAKAKWVEV